MPVSGYRRAVATRGRRKGVARRAAGAVALVTALALTAAGCSSGDDKGADAKSAPTQDEFQLPDDLESSLEDLGINLDDWKDGAWKNWDQDDWLREAGDFINPIIEDLWGPERMRDADEPKEEQVPADTGDDQGVSDPDPQPLDAAEITAPYRQNASPVGKLFFDGPEGSMVCSGTVVADPANPGKSNLVATAGHCVHAGHDGGWYRNVAFVPSYNSAGKPADQLRDAPREELAPIGVWWADKARTTDQWISEGKSQGGAGAPYDFAMLHVKPEDGGTKSLEETTGAAVPVAFDAPAVADSPDVTAMGYPEAKPYDGQRIFSCENDPGRLSINPDQPTMYRIGCSMTAGSSGGGWFSGEGNGRKLVSVTSIGSLNQAWLAGPHLGAEAKGVFDQVSAG
ncbi:hypothetical protein SRB5_55450 [Streptomyces sp. RB5]|uniref:V8-like Glu-specific endopeptidase n=1 Tax=Streptomyces smaragdinus TaxID=2585196 RepID=A0A7K0CPF0_9ACTN|nr:trypsin-like peptidase domain-containing protein [Streptomyces smaragdinus]MQY15366.1 hypothetical protein [Streptomyces smaragdinus]